MKRSLIAVLLLVCGGGALNAEKPSKKAKADLAVLTAGATQQVALDAAETKRAAKAEQAKTAAAKQEQDAEESVVLIDSKAETEETGTSADYGAEREERTVPGGLPSSYGQCKGVINDGGRNILVFESIDDGSLSFVQLVVGKSAVSWKLLDRIPRSGD